MEPSARSAVAPEPAAAAIRLAEERRVDDPDRRPPIFDECHRDGDDREPVQEVGGAVERIDQPVPVGREPAALFADERDVRGGFGQEARDRPFARSVDDRHVVTGALLLRLARSARGQDRRASDAGRIGGDGHEFVRRHPATLPSAGAMTVERPISPTSSRTPPGW